MHQVGYTAQLVLNGYRSVTAAQDTRQSKCIFVRQSKPASTYLSRIRCVTIADDFPQAAGRSAGLQGFEMVHAVRLEPEEFSVDNGALTPTNKLRRYQLGKRYAAQIEAMYQEIAKD